MKHDTQVIFDRCVTYGCRLYCRTQTEPAPALWDMNEMLFYLAHGHDEAKSVQENALSTWLEVAISINIFHHVYIDSVVA